MNWNEAIEWVEVISQHRKELMNPLVRRRILDDFDAGVPVRKIHDCLDRQMGGQGELVLTVRDI